MATIRFEVNLNSILDHDESHIAMQAKIEY